MLSPQTLHLPPLRDLHPPARNPRDRRPRPRPRTETQVVNDTETTAPPFRLPRVTLPRQPEPPVSAAEREAGDQALGLTERQRDQAALERLRAERLASTRHRSEEHTSELQSLMRISYAVFCLKKKHTHTIHTNSLKHSHNTPTPDSN